MYFRFGIFYIIRHHHLHLGTGSADNVGIYPTTKFYNNVTGIGTQISARKRNGIANKRIGRRKIGEDWLLFRRGAR